MNSCRVIWINLMNRNNATVIIKYELNHKTTMLRTSKMVPKLGSHT